MRTTETRLKKMEQAMRHTISAQAEAAYRAENAAWRKAGGPFSFVGGTTREEAQKRATTLRELGLIQPIDKVVLVPKPPGSTEQFFRHCVLVDWTAEKRDAIKAALASPSPALPPGW